MIQPIHYININQLASTSTIFYISLVLPLHTLQSNPIQNSRKRRHSVIVDPVNNFAVKRHKPTHTQQHLNINGLATQDQYILRKAADILHVPVTHLRSAITELEEESEVFLPYYDRTYPIYSPPMNRSAGKGRGTPKPRLTSQACEKPRADDELSNYLRGLEGKSGQEWKQEVGDDLGASGLVGLAAKESSDSTFCISKNAIVEFLNCCSMGDDKPSSSNGYGKLDCLV